MFSLVSPFPPAGDQPQAIAKLTDALASGIRHQVLLGVTGSGKTFTIANVIAQPDRPTLVLSHNKTLAAQPYAECKGFFPHNAIAYFVSYFDYYQPEAYIPRTDTFIEVLTTSPSSAANSACAATWWKSATPTARTPCASSSPAKVPLWGKTSPPGARSECQRAGQFEKKTKPAPLQMRITAPLSKS